MGFYGVTDYHFLNWSQITGTAFRILLLLPRTICIHISLFRCLSQAAIRQTKHLRRGKR